MTTTGEPDQPTTDGRGAGPRVAATRIERYDPVSIEPRWQARWDELGLYQTDLDRRRRPPYYLLTMYPYPSGDLHIGHWYIMTPTDAIARFQRMHGENVFLPDRLRRVRAAGRERRDQERHQPARLDDVEHRRTCAASCGRWAPRSTGTREVVTADPDYYRWNQWFFLQFLKAGLAYRAKSPVDWCPNDGTLAREQVEGADRHCWRCGAQVEKRDLEQWYLRITKYADELLDFSGLDWPEPVRTMQTNWIGRSEGAEIVFATAPSPHHAGGEELRVFTTRPDTLFGATFMVLAPEHPLVASLTAPDRRAEVEAYVAQAEERRPRSSGCRPTARRPASPSAPTRSTRSTASGSRSSSPTTCWAATGPARSWPSRPTTSATSSSRRSSACRSGGS